MAMDVRVWHGQAHGQAMIREDWHEIRPERGLAVLVDGFGGGMQDQPAKATAEAITRYLERTSEDDEVTLPFENRTYCSLSGNVLCNAIAYANHLLIGKNSKVSIQSRVGASALVMSLDGPRCVIAGVGACQAWMVRGMDWRRMVAPMTLAAIQDPMQDRTETATNIPLAALGVNSDFEPVVTEFQPQPGDRIILATGAWSLAGISQAVSLLIQGEDHEIKGLSGSETTLAVVSVT